MLQILSWNYRGFPWNKSPKLSWISNEVNIILLVETWEHKESKLRNIDGFILLSISKKRSYRRGIGGIACYIGNNISSHDRVYNKYHFNQYIWIEIIDIMCEEPLVINNENAKILERKRYFFDRGPPRGGNLL